MKATTQLHELGQSLWVDDITRSLLDRGTLQRYIDDLPIRRGFAGEALFLKLRR